LAAGPGGGRLRSVLGLPEWNAGILWAVPGWLYRERRDMREFDWVTNGSRGIAAVNGAGAGHAVGLERNGLDSGSGLCESLESDDHIMRLFLYLRRRVASLRAGVGGPQHCAWGPVPSPALGVAACILRVTFRVLPLHLVLAHLSSVFLAALSEFPQFPAKAFCDIGHVPSLTTQMRPVFVLQRVVDLFSRLAKGIQLRLNAIQIAFKQKLFQGHFAILSARSHRRNSPLVLGFTGGDA